MKTIEKIIFLVFLSLTIEMGCNEEKSDPNGPVYRGEKGVVIRGTNEDNYDQKNGKADSAVKDSPKVRTRAIPKIHTDENK
jgi:hypothetical protein